MIYFRDRDLVSVVSQFRSSGIRVAINDNIFPIGRYTRLNDPEGNRIELWQAAE